MKRLPIVFFVFVFCSLTSVPVPFAAEGNKVLILYYSYTGKTRAVCEVLQKLLGADMLEIKDLKNDPGKVQMGGGKGMKGKKAGNGKKGGMAASLVWDTHIEPQSVEIAPYSHIILGSPVWMGGLSPAIQKCIASNNMSGKKVIILTTSNAPEKEEQQARNADPVKKAGADVVEHYQILAKRKAENKRVDRTVDEMVADVQALLPELKSIIGNK